MRCAPCRERSGAADGTAEAADTAGPFLRVTVLASGSGGNSLLVEAGPTRVLVDSGLSAAALTRRLTACGCRPEELQGVLVSHEHTDHIQGVGPLARRYALPVYLTAGTREAGDGRVGELPRAVQVVPGEEFDVGELRVHPFAVPHDAREPVAYTLSRGRLKVGIATDMGFVTALAVQHLSDCALLVLEANHDPGLLEAGPYPWELKRRIRGRQGHLSNEEAGSLLDRVLHDGLRGIVLAHLSEKNNRPDLAREAAAAVLERSPGGERVHLAVAGPEGARTLSAAAGPREDTTGGVDI